MNFMRALGLRRPVASTPTIRHEHLPEVHAFVEVAIGDSRKRQSIPIDAVEFDGFSTRFLPRMQVGGWADFLYTNSYGIFRFRTKCIRIDEDATYFSLPVTIKTISDFGTKRSAVRLDSIVPVHWRFAPGDEGNGDFVKASVSDLSRGGAALIVAHDLKIGARVELRLTLESELTPVVVLSEVTRAAKIETSGKSAAGVRFLNVDAAAERAISTYINERKALRRKRGVV